MAKPKKTHGQTSDQAVEDLADIVIETLQDSYNCELEPFEAYASRVRARIYADVNLFRQRFHHGYRLLMDEMTKK